MHRKLAHIIPKSLQKHQELLTILQTMQDNELESWVEKNRDDLTLTFLGWVADQEEAQGMDQQRLWELGGKLMAFREGLVPMTSEQLNEKLRLASKQNMQKIPFGGANHHGQPTLQTNPDYNNNNSLPAVVRSSAILGLSAEGMSLLEQQAAALEATIGTTKATTITEILGRASVPLIDQTKNTLLSGLDPSMRILEVLVQIEDRSDRSMMLPDAFAPPFLNTIEESNNNTGESDFSSASASTAASLESDDEQEQEEEDEYLYTTPFQLMQSIDVWLSRLKKQSSLQNGGVLLNGNVMLPDIGAQQLRQRLVELREDIMNVWDSNSTEETNF